MAHTGQEATSLKRKRSVSAEAPPLESFSTSKIGWPQNQVQINYLVRQYSDDLPLISAEEPLPHLVHLLNEYHGVLDRHESMAGVLGARPLGPILIRRFERIFEGPPRVLKAHGKSKISWLDVVEFARSKPEEFKLSPTSDGAPVCQFNTRQCHVQISEEDYQLITSGIFQKMIPPQPIMEDEEKELGTLEILEKNISHISHLADQVAARARLFNHKLRARKQAIVERRRAQSAVSGVAALRASSPSNVALMNGTSNASDQSPSANFPATTTSATHPQHAIDAAAIQEIMQTTDSSLLNPATVSQTTRSELLRTLTTSRQRQELANSGRLGFSSPKHSGSVPIQHSEPTLPSARPAPMHSILDSIAYRYTSSPHPNSTPASGPVSARHSTSFGEGGIFRAEMIARVEALARGERVYPPCDRCRRLRMDCVKNLTACVGCTKKHAKCAWKDVNEEEVRQDPGAYLDQTMEATQEFRAGGSEIDEQGGDEDRSLHDDYQAVGHGGPRLDDLATEAQFQVAHSLAMAAMDRSSSDGQRHRRDSAASAAGVGSSDGDGIGGVRYQRTVASQNTTDPQLQDVMYAAPSADVNGGNGISTPAEMSGSSSGGGGGVGGGGSDYKISGMGMAVGS